MTIKSSISENPRRLLGRLIRLEDNIHS